MFEPKTYAVQLALMITSMCCWGSWANTLKLTPGWRFQSFYWDYVVGLFFASLAFGTVLGGGAEFWHGLTTPSLLAIGYALLAGIIFNAANQLLVAAIDLAGLAVAFPIGIGLALVIGVLLNYLLAPAANPILLFGGVLLVAIAIVVDAMAYRKREHDSGTVSKRGIFISLLCGVLMGVFYPFLTRAMQGDGALGCLYGRSILRDWRRTMCFAAQLLAYEASVYGDFCGVLELYGGKAGVASLGCVGRHHLVCRTLGKPNLFASADGRAGCFVRDWPRRYDDLCRLGSVYLEGVSQCSKDCERSASVDVRALHRRLRAYSTCAYMALRDILR